MERRIPWLGVVLLAACGGAAADDPLTVPVGLTRDALAGELRRFEYCAGEDPPTRTETFRHCDVPGHEHSVSWVIAHYDGAGRVWKIQRFERYSEETRTLDRFNTLVEKRSAAAGPPNEEAKTRIARQQQLPDGTKTWVAFAAGEETLVAVYLLEPRPPGYATLLEEVLAEGHPATVD